MRVFRRKHGSHNRITSSLRRLWAGLLLVCLLLIPGLAQAQTGAQTVTLDWYLATLTWANSQVAQASPATCTGALQAIADVLEPVTAVQLPDGSLMRVQHDGVAAALRAEPCDLQRAAAYLGGICPPSLCPLNLPPGENGNSVSPPGSPGSASGAPGDVRGETAVPGAGNAEGSGEGSAQPGQGAPGATGAPGAEGGTASGADPGGAASGDNGGAAGTDSTDGGESSTGTDSGAGETAGADGSDGADNASSGEGNANGDGDANSSEEQGGENAAASSGENGGSEGDESGSANGPAGNSAAGASQEGSTGSERAAGQNGEDGAQSQPNPAAAAPTATAVSPNAEAPVGAYPGAETTDSDNWHPWLFALLVVTLLFGGLLVWALRRNQKPQTQPRPKKVAAAVDAGAQQLRLGNSREAVRQLFLAALHQLDDEGLLRYDETRTNTELLAENAVQHVVTRLTPIVYTFERVWYGFEPLANTEFEQLVRQIDAIRQPGTAV